MNTDGHDLPLPSPIPQTLQTLDTWLSLRELSLEVRSDGLRPSSLHDGPYRVVVATLRRVDRGVLIVVASATGRTFSRAVENVIAFWERERSPAELDA